MNNLIIEKLDTALHNRENFDCGIPVLNVYLQTRANQEQKKRLNVTYAAVLKTEKSKIFPIAGYYTLSNSAIALAHMSDALKRGVSSSYEIPTVKMGRLAVDRNSQGQGVGKLLLKNAFRKVIEISMLSGIKGIEVIAKDERAVQFYESFGFVRLIHADKLLFLPIETVHQAVDDT